MRKLILRAALLAVLCFILGLLMCGCAGQKETDSVTIVHMPETALRISPIITEKPVPSLRYSETPISTEIPIPQEAETQTPIQSLCTLTIHSEEIIVLIGVDKETLKKHPGWLTSSVLPGREGMCVIYGHRNRNHLRALEKATLGDTIEVTMADGTAFVYQISDVTIYESTDEVKLSTVDGKALVLVTCYPFRYSGSAPGKCVVTAIC